jgi:hypothetical protein
MKGFAGLVVGICVLAAAGWGQETRATVSGTVTDPQGAVIPAARIEVRNLGTNVVTAVETNGSGFYTIPPVNPGMYAVMVTAPGFKTVVREKIELRLTERLALDFRLELGTAAETVMVTAEAPLVDTQTATAGTLINRELVQTLPTFGRDINFLAQFTAGVQYTALTSKQSASERAFDKNENAFSINGGAAFTNEVLLDGSPNTSRESGNPTDVTIVPPPEAVGEMNTLTNLYDASYGRTGGGVISVSLRSGTNEFHGATWWYVRNPVFNANQFEANVAGTPRASYRLNQPGFMLSGPVHIPKLYDGRKKTFFMYTLEIFRDDRPQASSTVQPTDLQRAGNFSQTYISGLSGPTVTIYDPLTTAPDGNGGYTRQPFAGNVIPGSRINPIAANIAKFILPPNIFNTPRGQPNLIVAPNYDNEPYNAHVLRVDQVLGAKHTVFVNFNRANRHQTNGVGNSLSAYKALGTEFASNTYKHWRINHMLTVNLTSSLSPTFISTARASYNRHQFAIDPYSFDYDPTKLGFPADQVSRAQTRNTFPAITFSGGGYAPQGGTACCSGGRTLNFSDTWSVGETLTKVIKRHTFKFGGEGRDMFNNQFTALPFGNFAFSSTFTQANPLVSSASSGDALASFLLGYPSSVSSGFNNPMTEGQRYYDLFAQDDWRITDRLTLNFGLRWDYESPISDRYDHLVCGFDRSTVSHIGSTSGPAVTGGLTFCDSNHRLPYKRDLNNFGPRFGFAYRLSSKTVVRGGWGITYAPTADVAPTTGYSITTSPSTSVANAGLMPVTTDGCTGANCGMLSNPFPGGILTPNGSSLGLLTNVGSSVSFISPDRLVPYFHNFSVGFQRELPLRSVLEINYNGTRGRNLATSMALNSVTYAQYLANGSNLTGTTVPNPFAGLLPGTSLNSATMTLQQSLLPYPQFTGVTQNGMSLGTNRYDALRVRLEKRLSGGLTVLFTFTKAKNWTYNSYLNNGMDAPGQFITRIGSTPPTIVTTGLTYSFPFFNKSRRALRATLGGWQIAGTVNYTSGALLNISGTTSTGIDPTIPNPTMQHWFNTCTYNNTNNQRQNCQSATEPVAWIIQKPFTLLFAPNPQFGDLRAKAWPDTNVSFIKAFRMHERLSAELRAEFFNLTNTPQFGAPNLTATSSLFGVMTLTQTNDARNIQMGAKITF